MFARSAAETSAKTIMTLQQGFVLHASEARYIKKSEVLSLMKEFEKFLNGKLPKDKIQSGMILSIVKNTKINDKQQLLNYLQNQELLCREWLAKNKTASTMNDRRREYVRKLEDIRIMKKIVDKL